MDSEPMPKKVGPPPPPGALRKSLSYSSPIGHNSLSDSLKNSPSLRRTPIRIRRNDGGVHFEERSEDGGFMAARKDNTDYFIGSSYFDLVHFRQTEAWDCGLTCLAMLLSKTGRENADLDSLKKYQVETHHTTVVWTVCLAYIVKHFHFKNSYMHTTEKNISANYSTDIDTLQQVPPEEAKFKVALEKAISLVQHAPEHGVHIFEGVVSGKEWREKIMAGKVAVVLINSLIFGCLECAAKYYDGKHLCPMPTHGNPYRGHYILIIGYNAQQDVYLYKNPDCEKEICFVPAKVLHKSRKSYGTQQNVIFVDLRVESQVMIQR